MNEQPMMRQPAADVWTSEGVMSAQAQLARSATNVEFTAEDMLRELCLAAERDRARIARRGFEHRAPHGKVTGMPNVGPLLDRLEHAVRTATAHHRAIAVLIVNIEGFTDIDDTLGHAAANVVLAEVARRLSLTLGGNDTLAGLARGEFVVICEDLTGPPAQIRRRLHVLGRRIQRNLRRPPGAREVDVVVSVSIGVAIANHPRSAQGLINAADRAVHRGNQRGRGQLFFSQPQAAPRVPGQTE